MATTMITLPKREYKKLVTERDSLRMRYDSLRRAVQEDIFSPPPTKSAGAILKGFQATGKYNEKFLESLKKGLARSSYFRTS